MIFFLIILRISNVSEKFIEKIKTHRVGSMILFGKSYHLRNNIKK